ncbi:MAG: FHA domain-containing protein [Christensenella sp.]|nr:FHA domain-containing protein [Christensenella sp.]
MDSTFEIVSYAMRYWFIAIVLIILIAVIYISYKEYQQKKYVMTEINQFAGYMQIIGGPREFLGDRFGLADENEIGSAQNCDIAVPDRSILPRHAHIYRQDDDFYLEPASGADTKINGRRAINAHKLKTGDKVSFGNVDMRVYFKRTRIGNDN